MFVSSLAVSLLAHLDAPAARRAVAGLVSDAASKDLRGRIDVVSIDRISPRGIDIGELAIRDPRGRDVINAYGAHVRYDLVQLGKAFLSKGGATPTIDHVFVERVNVALIPNEEGAPTLADAFAPKVATPKKGPNETPPPTFRLAVPAVDVQTIEVWGQATPGMWVSGVGEISGLGLWLAPEATTLSAEHARLAVGPVAGTLPAATTVDTTARVRFPAFAGPGDLGVLVDHARIEIDSAGTHATITGSTDEKTYDARIEVSEITPATVAKLTGAPPPIVVPVSLALDVRGTTRLGSIDGVAHVGEATAMVDGTVDFAALATTPTKELPRVPLGEASVHLRGVDPAVFAPGAPSLGVSSDLTARAVKTLRGVELTLNGQGSTSLDGQAGALELEATALIGENEAIDASGKVQASLGRSNADVTFDMRKRGAGITAHADFKASASALEELKGLHEQPIKGRVDVSGAADLDLGSQTFAMSAKAHAIGFRHPSIELPNGTVSLSAKGPLDDPQFTTELAAQQVVLSPNLPNPYRLHDVTMMATGTSSVVALEGKLGTDAGQRISISTHVSPTATGARIAGTKLELARDSFRASIAVSEVKLDDGAISVTGFRMSSTAGGLRLDGSYDPKRHKLSVEAASTPLDLAALARGAGVEVEDLRGTLQLNAKLATIPVERSKLANGNESGVLHLDPNSTPKPAKLPVATAPYVTGHVKLDLADGHLPRVGEVEAHVDVDVEDRWIAGDVGVDFKELARIALHGAALVPGRLDDPKAWRDVSTHVDLRIPKVDLTKVSRFLSRDVPPGTPVTEYAGLVDVVGHVERRDKDGAPTGFLNIDTTGLAMHSGKTRIDGVDLRVRAGVEGEHDEDGDLRADRPLTFFGIAEARDNKGPLAIVHLGTEGVWNKLKTAGQALADMPFTLNVIVPPRELDRFPRGIAKSIPIHGTFGVAGHGEGTLGAPKIDLRARIEGMAGNDGTIHDGELTLTYDGVLAKLGASLQGRNDASHKLLALDGELKVRALDILAGGKVPWTAKLDAKLDGMPIDFVAVDSAITGSLRGELHADHINDPNFKAATVDGRIDVDKLKVGEALFEESYVVVKVDENAATGALRIHGKDGTLDAKANVPLVWQNAASPAMRPGAPVEASLDAKNFRLRVAEPFVTAVDDLDGRLDAHITARVTKKSTPDGNGAFEGAPEGTITLREGVIVADAVGERWEHVTADVKIANNKIELPKLELRGRGKGRATISGNATLDGFMPKMFHVNVDAKRFSIASMGARVGDLSGTVVVDGKMVPYDAKREQMVIDIKLDPLTIDLAAEAGKQVQPLDEDPTIIVAQPIGPPVDPPAPAGTGMPMKVAVHIPNSVWVRRDDLRIAVNGNPSIEIDGPAKFAGEVKIEANPGSQLKQRSWIDVVGKRFYVQQSRIAFQGNEDFNPKLDVEVRWQAPDRSIVQVRVTGNMKTPKITFRALDESGGSLGLTQGEVMSLLVLGRRDAGSAKQQRDAERGAASQTASLVQGMTGAIVGRQLQKLLPTSMSLSLAPGRYSGGYQRKNVYFEVAYNAAGARMGPYAIGQTIPRTTFGIEWRFARTWSLMTTLGDTGSALVDLLWHYRY